MKVVSNFKFEAPDSLEKYIFANMNSVVIIGAGNVAFHLTRALLENTVNVIQIFNRTLKKAEELGESNNIAYTNKISELKKADLYIIATSDRSVEELSHYIPYEDTLVVHTSGSMGMDTLKGKYRKGVLYPMQSFTKYKTLRYDKIPFFIETQNKIDEEALFNLAYKVSDKVYKLDSEKRMQIHMAGVWVNNFTNHLFYLGQKICEEVGVPFDALLPLIEETGKKVSAIGPYKAQTGPARRGDDITINKHLDSMENSELRDIYQLLTNSIRKTYQDD